MEENILLIISLIGIYMLVGAIFSIIFLWRGIVKIDQDAEGTSKAFRLLLFPGLLIFWPIFLNRWIKHK